MQFDQNVAQSIITEKPGAATKLLYQLYIALQKKKKTGLTGLEIQTMQPQTNQRLQALKSEAFREVGTERDLIAFPREKLVLLQTSCEVVVLGRLR